MIPLKKSYHTSHPNTEDTHQQLLNLNINLLKKIKLSL
jgi:hypothetical protein